MPRSPVSGALVVLVLCTARIVGQCDCREDQRLSLPNGGGGDSFGWSLAVEGELLVVGTPFARFDDVETGAASVFRFDGTRWVEEQQLIASDGAHGDNFGRSVAISGEVLFVGSPSHDGVMQHTGAVYVFRHDGSEWVETQKIEAHDAAESDNLGFATAADGDTLVAGAPGTGPSNDGGVYVFRDQAGTFVEDQKLSAGGARLGSSVAVRGDVVVAGAPDVASRTGAAYVFVEELGFWTEERLEASDGTTDSGFGTSVAVSAEGVLAGCPGALTERGQTGAVYLYRRDGPQWSEEKLVGRDSSNGDLFGSSLSIDGDQFAVGAAEDGQDSGSAYLFRTDGSRWLEQTKLVPTENARSDRTGFAIGLHGPHLVVGSPGAEVDGVGSGTASARTVGDLSLQIEPQDLSAGDAIRIESCTGRAGGLSVLYIREIDGVPLARVVKVGRFRGDGLWILQNTVPPGLGGLRMSLQTLGFTTPDAVGSSRLQSIEFH